MFKKVLILSAAVGAGHVRAAEAVERAFHATNAAVEVRHVDTLAYTNKLFRRLYGRAYIDLVKRAPAALGWLYDQLDKPWKNERRRLALDKLNTRPFVKLLKDYRPDFIVCTHFLPAEIVSWLKAKERISSRQAIVVTDFDAHAMWLCHHYEHYFVPLDETREYLTQVGIAPEKISVSGIPVDPVFAEAKDQREMRRKHGLRADATTILISAGGFGVGPVKALIESLTHLRHPAQVVALCGRNAELKAEVSELAARVAPGHSLSIKPLGYTTEMDEYMAAADMILGKPGGLTTAEALAKGLVFVIVNPIPGQEERNSDHLLEQGVALRCNNLPVLAYKIDKLLDDPARFARMSAQALRLARPRAAFDIVTRLLELKTTGDRIEE